MIEKKVQAGTLSAAASGVVLWVLATYVFKDGMPQGIESLVYLIVPGVLAGAASYLAPHTHRPDLSEEGLAATLRDAIDTITEFSTAKAATPPSNVTVKP